MIAKLICSRHKPRQQTVIPDEAIPQIFRTTRISSIRNLGGKLGCALMSTFAIETMAELSEISFDQLNERFSAQAKWIANIAKGIDDEPVRARDKQTSIAVSKNFPGSNALTQTSDVQFWLNGLVKELVKRLVEDQVKNERTACTLHVGCTTDSLSDGTTVGKSFQIVSYAIDAIYNASWSILRHCNKSPDASKWHPPLVNISLSASRFHDGIDQSSKRITEWINRKVERITAGKDSEVTSQSTPSHPAAEATTSSSLDLANVEEDDDDNVQILCTENKQKPTRPQSTEVSSLSSSTDGYLPNSLQDISPELLANMPEDIRKELSMYYLQKRLQQQHAAAATTSRNNNNTTSSTMKKPQQRKSSTTKKRPSSTSHSHSSTEASTSSKKKISDFFKKSS